ncbi:MAG: Ig-like domain-containing protein [Ruminococcus sp.]|nr:Ig-like domain-containing protein [Ruminococcus sp.]
MKKTALLICIIALVPLILCSCFEKEVQSIELSEAEVTMTVGDSLGITAKILPEDAKTKSLDWTSSDNKIVTVSDGTLKAKSAGTAVVTAKAENDIKATCNVTVTDKEVTSITLSSANVSVKEGKKIQLLAKTQPSDAPSGVLEWSSSDENIAIVNSDGYVTGVKSGVANIICKSQNGKEASCTVTVKSEKVTNPVTPSTAPTRAVTKPPVSSNRIGKITTMNSSPSEIGNTYKGDFIFYDSSYRLLNSSEASMLSSAQVQQAINEIYARYGRAFKNSQIRAYFQSTEWYIENPSYSDSYLNDIEKSNIALLAKYR